MFNTRNKVKNRLREARFDLRMSQPFLWLKSGVHFSTISRIENGFVQPSAEQKRRLSKALDVDMDWLFPNEVKANDED